MQRTPPFTMPGTYGRFDLAELSQRSRARLVRVLLWRDQTLMLLGDVGGTPADALRVQAVADALVRRIVDNAGLDVVDLDVTS